MPPRPANGSRSTPTATGRSPTIRSSACCAATASAATSAACPASPPAPSRSSTPPSPRPTAARRKIVWFDVHAGDVAREMYYPAGQGRTGRHASSEDQQRQLYLPDDTLKAFEYYARRPQGAADHAHRRRLPQHQRLSAHALRPLCLRPARAAISRASMLPTSSANKVDMVIFRENTEDVYCGIEFKSGTDKAQEGHRPAQGDGLHRRAAARPASASSR